MGKTLQEFKEFIAKGNVLDMAVGVIIGGAFGKIVASLVNDILMPVIGLALGGIDFSNLFVSLDGNKYETFAEAQEAGGAVLAYGNFIQNVIDFLIIAFVIFLFVKKVMAITSKFKKEKPADPTTKECMYCKTEIPLEATRCPACTSELS
ncbi:MAG: large conductance mechanosensitive channel protein MscL [Tissierellia bacterium]|nr:large conductance mechanosensitive channel protein MscL [Tissierellia bacterium]